MTDMTLTDAIAEVRRVTPVDYPFDQDDFPEDETYTADAKAAILNAVASGDLVPVQCCMCGRKNISVQEGLGGECQLRDDRWVCGRERWDRTAGNLIPTSDARLAVAEAYHMAGNQLGMSAPGHWLVWETDKVREAILALADRDALASIRELRMQSIADGGRIEMLVGERDAAIRERDYKTGERNEALNCNAKQAGMIAVERAKVARLIETLNRMVNPAPGVSGKLPPWAHELAVAALTPPADRKEGGARDGQAQQL